MGIGLLALLGIGTIKTVGAIKQEIDNANDSVTYRSSDGMYFQSNTGMRLVSNHHKAFMTQAFRDGEYPGCRKGDRVLIDLETFKVVKNYGNEMRDNQERWDKESRERWIKYCEGKSFIYYGDKNDTGKVGEISGLRVYDRETGKKLALHYSPYPFYRYFLVDAETGYIVRESIPEDHGHGWTGRDRSQCESVEKLNEKIRDGKCVTIPNNRGEGDIYNFYF